MKSQQLTTLTYHGMQICKLKIKKKSTCPDEKFRFSTDYGSKNKKDKNKLTFGCKKYDEIKDLYTKQCEGHSANEMTQFTFQPNLSNKNKGEKSRSLKKFLQDQESYLGNRQTKIKEFKTELEKAQANQNTCRPSIDKFSRKICEQNSYNTQSVFERLSKQKVIKNVQVENDLFSPKILNKSKSLKRSKKIGQILHTDALRRQTKREIIESERKKVYSQSPLINRNTNILVNRKIYNEFCECIPEDELEVPFVFAWTVFSELFNIDMNSKPQFQERLCQQMMDIVSKNTEMVQRQTLWDFIEIIIFKGEYPSRHFNQKDIEKILNIFGSLYSKRMERLPKSPSPQRNTFKPETLKISQKYAQRHREKVLTETNEFIKNQQINYALKSQARLEDMFMADYLMKQASNEKKKLKREEDEMKQCTFKPKLNQNRCSRPNTKSFTKTLTNLSEIPHRVQGSETDTIKSTTNSLQNSNITNILKSRNGFKAKKNRSVQVKDSEKSVFRMSVARQDRNFSKQYQERGYPGDIENWNTYARKKKNQLIKTNKKMKGYAYKKVVLK